MKAFAIICDLRHDKKMFRRQILAGSFIAFFLLRSLAQESIISDDNPLAMPSVGAHQLRVLSPTLLELTLITTKKPDPARPTEWNFVDSSGNSHLPHEKDFVVLAGGKTNTVKSIGFKRRVLYAPLKQRDLRIGNYLYLQLALADWRQSDRYRAQSRSAALARRHAFQH